MPRLALFLPLLLVVLVAAEKDQNELHHYQRARHVLLQRRTIDTATHPHFNNDEKHHGRLSPNSKHQYLVHLKGPIKQPAIDVIQSETNVKFGPYIPHNTFLVVATASEAEKVRAHNEVLWVGAFHPEDKVSLPLTHKASSPFAEISITLHSKLDHKSLRELAHSWSLKLNRRVGPSRVQIARTDQIRVLFQNSSDAGAAASLLSLEPEAHWIEPVLRHHLHSYGGGTGQVESGSVSHSSLLAAAGIDGTGETVAIGDSGIDWASCFFGETSKPPADRSDFTRKIVRLVTVADDKDNSGHGTAVAGVIAGNASGNAYNGLAPGAKLYVYDLGLGLLVKPPTDLRGYFAGPYSEGVLTQVSAFGAVNVTWYTDDAATVDSFLYDNRTFVAVFSAGNEGVEGSITSPAIAKNAITVGASQNVFEDLVAAAPSGIQALVNNQPGMYGAHMLSPFSSRGPTADGRIKPDVVAPSFLLTAAAPGVGNSCQTQALNGSSAGAGLVAAAAVLVRQYLQKGFAAQGAPAGPSAFPNPTSALIKAIILNGGTPLHGAVTPQWEFYASSHLVPDFQYGFGLVNLFNTLYLNTPAVQAGAPFGAVDNTTGLATGETYRFCFTVQPNATTGVSRTTLKVTLVWTDPPGTPTSGVALVNNLDLVLLDASGREYRSNNQAAFDALNNVEQISVPDAPAGTYAAYVYAYNVPVGARQPFALVVSGNVALFTPCPAYCPSACSYAGTCVNSGESCQCNAGHSGIDCSITPCPHNCTAVNGQVNGICDPVTAQCICAEPFAGADCRSAALGWVPKAQVTYKGLSAFLVLWIAIICFATGAVACGLVGYCVAMRKAERDDPLLSGL